MEDTSGYALGSATVRPSCLSRCRSTHTHKHTHDREISPETSVYYRDAIRRLIATIVRFVSVRIFAKHRHVTVKPAMELRNSPLPADGWRWPQVSAISCFYHELVTRTERGAIDTVGITDRRELRATLAYRRLVRSNVACRLKVAASGTPFVVRKEKDRIAPCFALNSRERRSPRRSDNANFGEFLPFREIIPYNFHTYRFSNNAARLLYIIEKD